MLGVSLVKLPAEGLGLWLEEALGSIDVFPIRGVAVPPWCKGFKLGVYLGLGTELGAALGVSLELKVELGK